MFGSDVISVIVGLALVYFLLSTIVSGISEVLEAFLSRRALYLEAGILELLGPSLTKHLYGHPAIKALSSTSGPPPNAKGPHVVARTLSRARSALGRDDAKKQPSYISASAFSNALLSVFSDSLGELADDVDTGAAEINVTPLGAPPDPEFSVLLGNEIATVTAVNGNVWTISRGAETAAAHAKGTPIKHEPAAAPTTPEVLARMTSALASLPDGQVRSALVDLMNRAGGNIDTFRKNAEAWFDDKMDRVSGWYKRRTKPILFVIGLVLVVTINADSVYIARTLWRQPALRESVTAAAQSVVQSNARGGSDTTTPEVCKGDDADPVACVQAQLESVQELGIPLGWPSPIWWQWASDHSDDPRVPLNGADAAVKLAGLLFTALALTLGAPFWFDLMNKVVNFRSTGSPPQKEEEKSS